MSERVKAALGVLTGRLVAVPAGPPGGVRVVDGPEDRPGVVRVCDNLWVARIPCQHCGALEGQYHRPDQPTDTIGKEWDELETRRCGKCGVEVSRRWWLYRINPCPACGGWGEMVANPEPEDPNREDGDSNGS